MNGPQPTQSKNQTPPSGSSADAGALRLLDRESPEDYVREWTERIAQEKQTVETGTVSVAIFRIGIEWLALPTRIFQEVAEQCPVHSLPHRTSAAVVGLANVRGELLVCVSLGAVLGLTGESGEKTTARIFKRLLVTNRDGSRLVFPVDEVFGLHRYHPRELKAAPATLAQGKVSFTIGMIQWRDKTFGCLDDELLFYALNKSLA